MSNTLYSAIPSRKRRDLGGELFFFWAFSLHLQLKQPLKIPLKTSHTERQLFFFCRWRWREYNGLWSWKSGQTLGFTKEKGENQGLLPQTTELIQHQTDTSQQDRRVGILENFSMHWPRISLLVQARVSSGITENKGAQWISPFWPLGTKPPPNSFKFGWTLKDFWKHLGKCYSAAGR